MGAIFKSLKKRFPDYPKIHEVEDFVTNLTREMDPLIVIMFGALPRGDYTYNSDVDVLLIFEEPVTWNEVFLFSKGVVQPIAKTRDNFIMHLKKGNAFFIQIMEEGIILHQKPGILEQFKEIAAGTIGKLKMDRVEKGWDDIDQDEGFFE
jgi:Polymerase beta, Nucleotidyltransferase